MLIIIHPFLRLWGRQRHLASVSVMMFGFCHLILFVSSTNSIQKVRRQCCIRRTPTVLVDVLINVSKWKKYTPKITYIFQSIKDAPAHLIYTFTSPKTYLSHIWSHFQAPFLSYDDPHSCLNTKVFSAINHNLLSVPSTYLLQNLTLKS